MLKTLLSFLAVLTVCAPAIANDTSGYVLPTGGIVFDKQDGLRMVTPNPSPAQECQAEESLFDKCRALPEVQKACEKEKEQAELQCFLSFYRNTNVFVRYVPPVLNKGMIIQQNLQAEPGWRYFVKDDELYVVLALSHALKIKLGEESLLPYAEETKYTWEDLREDRVLGLEGETVKKYCNTAQTEYILFEDNSPSDHTRDYDATYSVYYVNDGQKQQLKGLYIIGDDQTYDAYTFCDGENKYLYFTGCVKGNLCGVLAYNLKKNTVVPIRQNVRSVIGKASNPAEIPNSDYFVYTVVRDEEPYSIELYTQQKLKQK